MNSEAETKIIQMLDAMSVGLAANQNETAHLRDEMRQGFARVDYRLGNLETRVENVETELKVVKTDLKVIKTDLQVIKTDMQVMKTELRSFRGEFESRIAPLER